ncbi:MAG: rod shape-determining protein, partial [Clostridia bacterium]|nr:rod shape-determining protein [Clostridia bacterium]
GIDINQPRGNMVVDIGAGTTDIAVISLGGSVLSDSIKVAGDKFDDAIVRYMRKKHNLLIGERTAEEMKIRIGSAYPRKEQIYIDVKGRNMISGLPQQLTIGSNEMIDALEEPLQQILEAVRTLFERTPPELASDIAENGICLTGGGALLYSMDKLVAEHTKVPCYVAEDPISCVAIGTGKVLDGLEKGYVNALYDYRRGDYFEV